MSTTTTAAEIKAKLPTERQVRERLAEIITEKRQLQQLLKCLPRDEQQSEEN